MAKKQTFEQSMQRLEEIVRLMEKGEASLEEGLRLFEEGSKLAASLHIQLEKAEQKVVQMTTNEDHTIKETPFDAQ